MLYSLRNFDANEIAQQRMKIIRFYEKYGEQATREAFGANRKVISRWRKRIGEFHFKVHHNLVGPDSIPHGASGS